MRIDRRQVAEESRASTFTITAIVDTIDGYCATLGYSAWFSLGRHLVQGWFNSRVVDNDGL